MKLIIPQHVYNKVMYWVNKTNIEVSGFGTVEYTPDTQTFTVTDAFLLKQTGGGAHTDIDAASLADLEHEVLTKRMGNLNWWWHSHVKMDTFWSGTDLSTIKELGRNGWITASVFNQHNKVKSAVCYISKTEFGGSLTHINDDMATTIEVPPTDPELIAAWDAEFTANVQEKKYVPPASYGSWLGGGANPSWQDDEYWSRIYGYSSKDKTRYTVYDKEGLAGYPVKDEAKALNMTAYEYVAILNKNDLPEIYKVEEKLLVAINKGDLSESRR